MVMILLRLRRNRRKSSSKACRLFWSLVGWSNLLLFCDLRAEFSDKIYATDASLQGGGVVSCDIDHDTSVKLLAAVDFRGVSVDLKLDAYIGFSNDFRSQR